MMIWDSACLTRSSFQYDFVLCWISTFKGSYPIDVVVLVFVS
jgi:hypothetical protein